ncbi:MAG: DUF3108 domain-containing protein, partial [Gemmatimonadaceae bacterium]
GDSLGASDLTATPAGVALDPRALVAGVDSFTVLLQGRPFGYQRTEVQRTDSGYTATETSRIGTIISQTTTITLDPALAMRRVVQSGKAQGQETSIDVSYAAGRARGSAATPTPPTGAVVTVAVDAEVPAGVIDDNALTLLLPAMPWTASSRFAVPVFASGQGKLQTYTLSVAGSESVTVPAGTFQAYRVEVTGGAQPMTLYIAQDAPHRLLKTTIAGAPIEVVRVR